MPASKNRVPPMIVKNWFETRQQLTDRVDQMPRISDDERQATKQAIIDLYNQYGIGLSVRLAGN